jgi:plastocyanin
LLFVCGMNNSLRLGLIMTAAVIVASCGSSSNTTATTPTSPSTSTTGTPVSVVSGADRLTTTAYNPNPLTISAGTTVTWTNQDSITHTATSDTGVFGGTLAPSAQFSFTFQNKGTFTYHCTIHPNMVGTITVQ